MSLKQDLGQRIQILRKNKKLTQEKFSELVGIDSKNISKIENGNNYPSPETLVSIAKALDVEIYELFVFKEQIPYEKMKEEIISALNDNKKVLYLYKMLTGI
ncbi:helix-turn-helix transcriptional regulator [bacterium]|nr:helix-turn-helix transcriptional regulator [bacterium]